MDKAGKKARRHEGTKGKKIRPFVPSCLCALVPLLLFLACSNSPASVTSALINKALDSQQKLDLNATLPQVIDQIGNLTGVRIEADPLVWDLLPWGEQTTITAKIENRTLRQGLTAITQKLGLEFVLTDETVQLQPMPALRRLGRRATVQELAALDFLTSTPIHLNSDRPTVREILSAVDTQLQASPLAFAVENRADDSIQDQHIGVADNATMAQALEDIGEQTTFTWYPWGKTLVVLPKHQLIRDQLGKTITTRYNGVDVSQVVQELLVQAGVNFTVDPGAYARIPPAYRTVHLLLDNATIQQALESIGGYTGLGFDITGNGVHVVNQSVPTTQNAER
jgi:hypothetical protein